MKDTRNKRLTQLYETALAAMKQYSSCEEYLSAEPEVRKPITVRNLSGFVAILQHQINEYDCCIDDFERAKVGTEILYWCRSVAKYDCVEEDEK
jgi:hypothetical protein